MEKIGTKRFLMTDKEKSVVDTKKSDPAKGLYFFKPDPKPVRYKLKDNTGLSPYWFHWIWTDPDNLHHTMTSKNYEFVTKKDRFVPEGMKIDNEGHYKYKDLVLMRCNLREWLQRRKESSDRSISAVRGLINSFKSHVIKEGQQANFKASDLSQLQDALEAFSEETIQKTKLSRE